MQPAKIQPVRVEKSSKKSYKIAIGVLVIIIIALAGFMAFGISAMAAGNQARAEQNVKDLYKIITGADTDVVKTTEQNGLYKMTVRFKDSTGRDTLQDVYVTRDGSFFTDRLVDLELQKSILINQSAFAQCLAGKQLRVLGLSSDATTQAQMQLLGAFSARVYFDCGGQNAAICQQFNITNLPVIFYNNEFIQGPKNLDWFEGIGCYMTANGTKAQ
jgi:hypothetical protein